MISHYLPLSISNRTAATIKVKHDLFASSSTAYTDLIEPYQTTPTKAIQTNFKLSKLEIQISIDVEQPQHINVQLVKRGRKSNHQNASNNSSTTVKENGSAQKKYQRGLNKSKLIGKKVEKFVLRNPNRNRKFLRLQVNYFLNSQPFSVSKDEEVPDEKVQDAPGPVSDNEPLLEVHPGEVSDGSLIPSNTNNDIKTKKRIIPQFEIFQSISDDGSVSIMILKQRNFSNWMSNLPDQISISELTVPGTHQSCSLYGWPVSQCQTRSLSRQLQDGIRFLDIRLALPIKEKSKSSKKYQKSKNEENGQLIAYHGIQSQIIKFEEILKILNDFLISQPTETVIVSIKRENNSDSELFKQVLKDELVSFYRSEENFHDHWWLKSSLPESLDQVRGKLILFSRKLFQAENDDDFGIRFPSWPNNSTEIWETSIPNTNVAVQDWYGIGSILSIGKKSSLACVSLCRALHEPLRSSSSPIPPTRSESPPETSEITRVEEQTQVGQNHFENESKSNEPRSLEQETTENEEPKTWVITFLSAFSLIMGFPTICARGMGYSQMGFEIEGINSRVARWLVSRRDHQLHPGANRDSSNTTINHSSIKGVVCLMDFYQSPKEALVSLLVDCNFSS